MTDPSNEQPHRYRRDHTRTFSFDLAAIFKDPKDESRILYGFGKDLACLLKLGSASL